MLNISKGAIFTVFFICLLGIIFASPNLLNKNFLEKLPFWFPKQQVNLGLDLQGGAHLLLEVDVNEGIDDRLKALLDDVRGILRKEENNINYLYLKVKENKITFKLLNPELSDKVKKVLTGIEQGVKVDVDSDTGFVKVYYSEDELKNRYNLMVNQSIEIVRNRIDELGTKEPNIQQQGLNRILIQLPGVSNPGQVKKLLGKTAKLTFHLIASDKGDKNQPTMILPYTERGDITNVIVERRVLLTGEYLVDASPGYDKDNLPCVNLVFDAIGAKKFADITYNYKYRALAIVLDGKVVSAPSINYFIAGGRCSITSSSFTVGETYDLAVLLRAGALPAPLDVIEERTVGPGLGSDSVKAGKIATVVSIILIAIFMVITYSFFGVVANIALFFNLVLLMAALSIFNATLTLPGIAGIALTMGMAVDANVLIYERIKEEIRIGHNLIQSIQGGYKRAMTTILDSNITTLIGAVLLYQFSSGSIRGFAVTLSLGIIISMFTAISLTRVVVALYLKWVKPSKLII